MPTLTDQHIRQRVSLHKEAEYVAYHEWLESLRRDEISDAAERVRAPQQTTIEFFLTPEGFVNDLGQALRPIIEGGLAHAEQMAATNSDWLVEVERRRIELEEYDIMEAMAKQGPDAGIMISRWLIPDAVRVGESSLPGYNRERLKMFNRYAAPTKNGLVIGYQSLDGSHYEAVQAMDRALGYEPVGSLGSEDIARERRIIPVCVESLGDLMDQQRDAYDAKLTELEGGEWYAGRPPIDIKEVTRFIAAQPDLVEAHMKIVRSVFNATRDRDERMRLLEPHRYNFAAALDARLYGEAVESLEAAGNAARDADMDYNGDCPTGTSAVSQLDQLGFASRQKFGACPHCQAYVLYDVCDPRCSECGATSQHGPTKKIGAQAVAQATKPKPLNRRQTPERASKSDRSWRHGETHNLNGATMRYEKRLVVGGVKEVLIDLQTGAEVEL